MLKPNLKRDLDVAAKSEERSHNESEIEKQSRIMIRRRCQMSVPSRTADTLRNSVICQVLERQEELVPGGRVRKQTEAQSDLEDGGREIEKCPIDALLAHISRRDGRSEHCGNVVPVPTRCFPPFARDHILRLVSSHLIPPLSLLAMYPWSPGGSQLPLIRVHPASNTSPYKYPRLRVPCHWCLVVPRESPHCPPNLFW